MNLRCYVFVNSILNTMQKGVQAAHAVAELGWICRNEDEFHQWIGVDKTLIILEGGGFTDMDYIFRLCAQSQIEKPLTWAFFREDKNTFNEQITAIAIILPDVNERLFPNADDPYYRALHHRIRDAHLAR